MQCAHVCAVQYTASEQCCAHGCCTQRVLDRVLHVDVLPPTLSAPLPDSERETSILIDVEGGTPSVEIEEPDFLPVSDSPPSSPPVAYSRRLSELEDALRTMVPRSPVPVLESTSAEADAFSS